VGDEGKVYGPSISSQVLDLIAPRYAVRRSRLDDYILEGVGSEDERRRILLSIRTILYMLKRKKLVHIVPRVLVVNVPLLLFYYNVNGRSIEKTATALTSGQIGLRYSRAVGLVDEVVSRYSSVFDDLVSQLLYFRKLHDKLMNVAVKSIVKEVPKKIIIRREKEARIIELDDIDRNIEAVERLAQLLENTFYHYLLYIIVDDEEKEKEFLNEIRRIFRSFSEHLSRELMDKWRYLRYTINRLAEDKDPRIRSTARSFLERVVYACLAI